MTWPLPTRKAWSPAATWSPTRCAAAACTCCRWTARHSAIFQCLQDAASANGWRKILLTASGGPFYGMTAAELKGKTKADALKHPNWNMGAKITIDSATLMNKGLELIEAVWLFGLPEDKIQIVVQRRASSTRRVQFADHSVIAQLGVPDMRIPIQYALTWPDRLPGPAPELDFAALTKLTFGTADEETFRCWPPAKRPSAKAGWPPAPPTAPTRRPCGCFCRIRSLSGHRPPGWSGRCGQRRLRRRLHAGPTSTSATKWRALTFFLICDPARAARTRRPRACFFAR